MLPREDERIALPSPVAYFVYGEVAILKCTVKARLNCRFYPQGHRVLCVERLGVTLPSMTQRRALHGINQMGRGV